MTESIRYEKQDHIITRQFAAEQAMLREFAQGHYTLKQPLVKLNCYEICPLTAMLLFKTPVATEVEVVVHGKEPAGDITHTFPAETEHILPIYGLYADYANQVEVILANGERQLVTIQTEPLHPDVPVAESIQTTAAYMGQNIMFLTAAMRAMPVGYDYAGDVRWYATRNFAFDLKRIAGGHILVGTERLVKMPYFTSGLYEMAMSGKIFKEYQLPSGYHHDQLQMADGNLLILTFDYYSGTVEDECVLVDAQTGEILKKWDYKDILPQSVAGSGSQTEEDWFHNNALWYDQKTNSLTLSGRHQDIIINIDYETGALNWMLGDPEGWPQEMVDRYFFTPVGEDFEWQYEQHACMVLPDGDIFVFDNGHYRAKDKEHYILNSQNYSRGVRYRINTEDKTIRQIWQYGKERGAEFFSPYISNVEYYDEGHYMVHSGGIGYEDGKTCDGFAVTRAMSPKHKDKVYTFKSITCELYHDELVYELKVPANCYRAEKLPLYYAGERAELGAGQVLGQMIETQTTKMKIRAEETGQLIPESYAASLIEEEDRLTFNATFESGELAQLLLIDQAGTVRRYAINTVAKTFSAMCVGTFQKADPRNVDVFVNKTGLNGPQTVKLLLADKIYETGLTINQ